MIILFENIVIIISYILVLKIKISNFCVIKKIKLIVNNWYNRFMWYKWNKKLK